MSDKQKNDQSKAPDELESDLDELEPDPDELEPNELESVSGGRTAPTTAPPSDGGGGSGRSQF